MTMDQRPEMTMDERATMDQRPKMTMDQRNDNGSKARNSSAFCVSTCTFVLVKQAPLYLADDTPE